jgi:thymidine phosphorylase
LPAQIIQKKRDGNALTEEEIRFFIDGFTSSELPEYQMASLATSLPPSQRRSMPLAPPWNALPM